MSKLLDRLHIHHDAPEREAAVRVPESQEVTEHHRRTTEPPPRAASGIRWLRWLGVIALFGGGIIAYTMLVNDEGTDVSQDVGVNSQQLVQESIDQAIADNQISTLDRAVLDLERNATTAPVSSYQLVQESIDQALAANQSATEFTPWLTPAAGPGSTSLAPTVTPTATTVTSYELVEANRVELVKDLALNRQVNDGSYDRAEANRVELQKDLALDRRVNDGSYDRAEANRMEVLRDM